MQYALEDAGYIILLRNFKFFDRLNFHWSNLFPRKNVHAQVAIFNQTLLNIFTILFQIKLLCDDRDLPWMNEKIKSLIKKKNVFYPNQKKFINFDYTTLDAMTLKYQMLYAF